MAEVTDRGDPALDVATPRKDFPLLARKVHGHRIVYLDSAVVVPDARSRCSTPWTTYYETTHANVHRGVYAIAEEADPPLRGGPDRGGPVHRGARSRARGDLHQERHRGHQPGRRHLGPRQPRAPATSSLLTEMEHHANLVPWLMLAEERGIELRWIPHRRRRTASTSTTSTGCSTGSKLVGVTTHVERARAPSHPFAEHRRGRPRAPARWCWPTAPSPSPTCPPTWPRSAVDFLAFTAHKMLGPTGIGVLWGRARAARGHAAVPGRRRDDPRRPPRRLHPQRAALEVRGRHPAHRRGGRARCRGRLPRGHRAWTPSAPTRSR